MIKAMRGGLQPGNKEEIARDIGRQTDIRLSKDYYSL